MEVEKITKDKAIRFYLRKNEEELMDNLSFVHLVMMKFDGEEEVCESFYYDGNDEYIEILVSFPGWNIASNAISHCNQNLGQDGNVKRSYKGALPNADPRGFLARKLLKRAMENRSN